MTSLPQERHTRDKIKMLYLKRWGIEQKHCALKNRRKLKSVTGTAAVYVYQYFEAQVSIYTMIQNICNCADAKACKSVRYAPGGASRTHDALLSVVSD